MTSQVKQAGVWTGAESSLWSLRVKAQSPDTRVAHAVSVVTVGLQLHDDWTLENKTDNCSTSLRRQQAKSVTEASTCQCQRGRLPVILSGLTDGSSSRLRSAAGSMHACVIVHVCSILHSPFQICSGLQRTWWPLARTGRPSHPPAAKTRPVEK